MTIILVQKLEVEDENEKSCQKGFLQLWLWWRLDAPAVSQWRSRGQLWFIPEKNCQNHLCPLKSYPRKTAKTIFVRSNPTWEKMTKLFLIDWFESESRILFGYFAYSWQYVMWEIGLCLISWSRRARAISLDWDKSNSANPSLFPPMCNLSLFRGARGDKNTNL